MAVTRARPFDGEYFADVTFSDLELEAADLTGREFDGCTFRRCKLPESRWARSVIEDSRFEDCDLSRMDPRGLALRGVRFENTRLVGVTWKGIEPAPDVAFEGCDLRYASFLRLRLGAVRMIGSAVREATFVDSDLTGADFRGSDLTGSTIQGCTLAKADFSRAKGVFFDPTANLVKGARVGLETAVLLARSFGLTVGEADADEGPGLAGER